MFLRNYVDLFLRTNGTADIKMDVSRHVETVEECDIMVFNRPYGYDGEKSFNGESLSLDEFNTRYPDTDFEIVTEGYCGYDTTFQGYI